MAGWLGLFRRLLTVLGCFCSSFPPSFLFATGFVWLAWQASRQASAKQVMRWLRLPSHVRAFLYLTWLGLPRPASPGCTWSTWLGLAEFGLTSNRRAGLPRWLVGVGAVGDAMGGWPGETRRAANSDRRPRSRSSQPIAPAGTETSSQLSYSRPLAKWPAQVAKPRHGPDDACVGQVLVREIISHSAFFTNCRCRGAIPQKAPWAALRAQGGRCRNMHQRS